MVSKSFVGILPSRPQHALLQQLHQQVANVLRWLCTTKTRKTPSVQWLWQGLIKKHQLHILTWHPLKKKNRDKHHHHWWRWTAEMSQPFLQRAGTALAKCLGVGVWKTVDSCHWKAVFRLCIYTMIYYDILYLYTCYMFKKETQKNDNDKLLHQ